MEKEKKVTIYDPISLDDQERLMEIMNNSPRITSFAGTKWEIRALHPQVIYWVAEEAVKIEKIEQATAGDVLVGMVKNFDSVIRILTLVLLNDKERIKNDYDTISELLRWESSVTEWGGLLSDILQMLNLNFFFVLTESVQMFRTIVSERKITSQEARLLSQGQNTDK